MQQNDLRLEKLADLLEEQALNPALSDGNIWQKLAVSERTFYRLKPKALQIVNNRASLRQQALANTITQQTASAAQKGLKSKTDRVLLLQEQIDDCLKELNGGEDQKNYSIVGGRLLNIKNQLTVEQKVALRRCIREYQAEISKIEGDYAPMKTEEVTKIRVTRK
jgi:hypothetical protein